MTTKRTTDDLARCRATIEEIAEQTETRGFDAMTICDAMLQICIALALSAFGSAATVATLRRLADRIERGERDGLSLTKH